MAGKQVEITIPDYKQKSVTPNGLLAYWWREIHYYEDIVPLRFIDSISPTVNSIDYYYVYIGYITYRVFTDNRGNFSDSLHGAEADSLDALLRRLDDLADRLSNG